MIEPNTAKLIKEDMPVLCSEDGQFAVVDHMEGADVIKLAKDADGQHHYIPLTWVTSVDDKVHIDRPGDQAKQEWATSPADARPEAATQSTNSVDATTGQPIIARVMARKHELEMLLERLPADHHNRVDIDLALSNVDGLITGDLAHLPAVVAAGLNQWLERSKHLGETTP